MSSLKTIWDCMFSPKLIKIYGNGPVEKLYQPSTLEKWGDQVINSLYVMWKFGVYTSPFLVGILYQRGYFEPEGLVTLTKLVTSVGVILVVSFCFRGLSRAQNPTYQNFFSTLQSSQKKMTPAIKQQLNMYDFEFTAWPVEYKSDSNSQLAWVPPLNALEQSLLQGRSRLIELYRGERFKIQTSDNNEIDTMFINKRNASPNGNTLVICCEGNAGFYEIGIAITPIEAGYSVLGWNHPGFGGSTFAINKLGFKVENILLFGWSIGGYTATWAAMNYPEMKGIILDATFDDILPLAVSHMPSWWEPIVHFAIREHVNLNIFEQLSKYPGPVLLIRRTEDEVICLKENDLSSNRGNHLLAKLLCLRYPCIYNDAQTHLLMDYLAVTQGTQDELFKRYSVDENMCQSLLQSYVSEYSKSYPMKIGEEFTNHEKSRMALFLARKYMKDFKSSHCVNLPSEIFQIPWDVNVESDFVFT
ncbi:hypothetical protein NQ314_001519 [Rhamnusium bicolor]|uniref:Abhydrolase domain-containing protein 16A n=1 Tax=Rhamnusium bicolor TaxID=1586634 RepID=A0AAV8ZS00_9CUCU|nr:hypothetical protein NQ314_001519 [Rhamnusium bicolor]